MAPPDGVTLADLGEDAFLRHLLRQGAAQGKRGFVGPGDDCAVIPYGQQVLLLKTDAVVEGVHFDKSLPPSAVGRKALNRAISDMAAMGGRPENALVTVFSPSDTSASYWEAVYRGIFRAARAAGVSLVGGELSSAPVCALSVALTGSARRGEIALRSGGRPGHVLYVTGRLGGSIRRKHWAFTPRLAEGQWLAQNHLVSAMMDLSDGLAADLPRLARSSGCGFSLNHVPCSRGISLREALCDGEDYELLFSVPPRLAARLETGWHKKFPRLLLTRIGTLHSRRKGREMPVSGFDHFLKQEQEQEGAQAVE